MSTEAKELRIALFGSKTDVWVVGALLLQLAPPNLKLTLAIDPDEAPLAAAQSVALDHGYFQALGLGQDELVTGCEGTLALGAELSGWHGDGSSLFSARTGTLPLIGDVALHHILLRAAITYEEPSRLGHLYRPFQFAARAAEQGKFDLPGDDPDSPLRLLGPIVQHDRLALAQRLAERAECQNVAIVSGRPVEVDQHGETGAVEAVQFSDGTQLDAHLFADLSGQLSALLETEDGAELIEALAPFDRFVAGSGAPESGQTQMRVRAMAGALLVETPLAEARDNAMLYCSDQLTDEQACNWVGFGQEPEEFRASLAVTPWHGNVVRMGKAAGQLGPAFSADALCLLEQAQRLVQYLPAGELMASEAAAYNSAVAQVMREIRDFALLPIALNRRADAPWASLQDVALPEGLELILEQFRSRGRFVGTECQIFDDQRWVDLLIAIGLVPERYDPRADAFEMKQLAPILQRIARDFDRALAGLDR